MAAHYGLRFKVYASNVTDEDLTTSLGTDAHIYGIHSSTSTRNIAIKDASGGSTILTTGVAGTMVALPEPLGVRTGSGLAVDVTGAGPGQSTIFYVLKKI